MRRMAGLSDSPLPTYDVRVLRELAHRRLALSLVRRVLRLTGLHVLDAVTVAVTVWWAARLSGDIPAPRVVPAFVAFILVALNVRGSYGPGPARRDWTRLVTGVVIASVLAAISTTLPGATGLSPEFFAYFTLGTGLALIAERQLVDGVVRQAYARGFGLRRALVVSRGHEAKDVIAGLRSKSGDFSSDQAEDQLVLGYVTPEETRDPASLGTLSRLQEVIDSQNVSELVIATTLTETRLSAVADACFARGVHVFVVPPTAHFLEGWTELTHLGRLPAYHLHPARLELPALVLKRATDIALSCLGLVVAAPLMLLIAAAIKLETRGPVFFRQRRVGLGRREFMMWKFRSMSLEAEAQQAQIAHLNPYTDGRLFKLADDPRVTKVGRVLRRFSLDELPQLFNIVAGDMSLVGPRPPLPTEVHAYEARHLVRLSVVPGLTGPWQVSGRNLITDFEEVVRLERAYIETWSLRSDLEIMLRTVGVVLNGRGAY